MLCQGRVIEADSVAEGYPAIGIRYLEIVLRSVEYFVVDRFTTGSIYTIETHALNNTGIRDRQGNYKKTNKGDAIKSHVKVECRREKMKRRQRNIPLFGLISRSLAPCLWRSKLLLDLCNGQGRVQTLGAGPRAVQNGVAPVHTHAVVQSRLALGLLLVTGVGNPSVGLEEDSGAQVFLAVPPVRGARGRAAGAENALVQTVELLAVLGALTELKALYTVRHSLRLL